MKFFWKNVTGFLIFSVFLGGSYVLVLYFSLPARFLGIVQKVFLAILILSLTLFISKVVIYFVRSYTEKNRAVLPPTSIFANLARLIVFILGGLILLQTLGVSITPLLTALGVGGLAVALALQDTLSNLFSGLHILISR